MTFSRLLTLVSFFCLAVLSRAEAPKQESCDVFVYGGTPGGIAAAISAARLGNKVTLADPGYFVGGMMAGGLTKTDLGNRSTIGGVSAEFFDRIYAYYKKTYGENSKQAEQTKKGAFFEPKIAALIFGQMLDEAGVKVLLKYRLEKATMAKLRIDSVDLVSTGKEAPLTIKAAEFIDATYEGDLLAAAEVPYRVGREAAAEYNESLAGMTSGPEMYRGKGDHRVQAYNIRSTITNRADILVPFPKPKNYDPAPHKHFVDTVKKFKLKTFEDLFHDAPLWGEVNGKLDPNKGDDVGVNYNYSEGSPEERARILQTVQDYWLSLWYMLANDPELPEDFRKSVQKWGLPADEFVESGHVTPQIYVRVARRMLGRYMLTQNDVMDERFKPDAICLGSYNIDSHDVQDMITDKGRISEGYIIQSTDPYEIPYRAITPFAPENLLSVCAVSATHIAYGTLRMEPVFMMIGQAAGTAAALAKRDNEPVQNIAVDELQGMLRKAGITLQAPFRPKVEIEVKTPPPYSPGQEIAFEAKVVRSKAPVEDFAWNFDGSGEVQATGPTATYRFDAAKPYTVSLNAKDKDGYQALLATKDITTGDATSDVEVTFAKAKPVGRWDRAGSGSVAYRFRVPYHDMDADKGAKSVTFETNLPADGTYKVAMAFSEDSNRATNVPVTVESAEGNKTVTINQKITDKPFAFVPLGEFNFKKGQPARVVVSNAGTKGFVAVDAIRWIPTGR